MAITIGKKQSAVKPQSLYDLGLGKLKIGFDDADTYESADSPASAASDEDVLSAYIDEMYARYQPEEIEFDEKTQDELSASVAAWLRPSYDQAIANRTAETQRYRAETDADAIARGMGASTYVTDVKERQNSAEASDIASLESDYGATLAKYVTEGLETQNEQKLETASYNAEQRKNAYDMAYAAAVQLFAYYKKSGGGASGKSTKKVTATTSENCAEFLNQLTKAERAEVYAGSTTAGKQYRAEILASVGYSGYLQLQSRYPSTP